MLSGISVICFATSYTVALLLEVSRLFFRSGIRGMTMFVFAGLGLFTHTVFLYHQSVNVAGCPLSSKQGWYFLAAWVLAAIYLYLSRYHPKTPFGVFILPIVLGLIVAGQFWADPTPFTERSDRAAWNVLHGTSLLLATVAVAVGFVSGVMYVEQAHRLKRKLPPRGGLRLPSLEWLGRANGRSIVLAIILLALGIISGMVLNSIHLEDLDRRISLADPLVFGTLAIFVWLVLSAGTSVLYRPAREGHKVAYLTVLSFIFLAIVLGLFLVSRHGQALPEDHEAFRPIPPAWRIRSGEEIRPAFGPPVSGDACGAQGWRFCMHQRQRGASPAANQDVGLICSPILSEQWPPSCSDPAADVHRTVAPAVSSRVGGMA